MTPVVMVVAIIGCGCDNGDGWWRKVDGGQRLVRMKVVQLGTFASGGGWWKVETVE